MRESSAKVISNFLPLIYKVKEVHMLLYEGGKLKYHPSRYHSMVFKINPGTRFRPQLELGIKGEVPLIEILKGEKSGEL